MNRFIITEEEKKDILGLYGVLNEENNNFQYLNIGNISGKTYNLYTEPGNKSTKIDWVQPNSPHPKTPKELLPINSDHFVIQPRLIVYYSDSKKYSISSKVQKNDTDTYTFSSIYTDENFKQSAKFQVTINYPTGPKNKWGNISFYGYSEDLMNDMVSNKLI